MRPASHIRHANPPSLSLPTEYFCCRYHHKTNSDWMQENVRYFLLFTSTPSRRMDLTIHNSRQEPDKHSSDAIRNGISTQCLENYIEFLSTWQKEVQKTTTIQQSSGQELLKEISTQYYPPARSACWASVATPDCVSPSIWLPKAIKSQYRRNFFKQSPFLPFVQSTTGWFEVYVCAGEAS